MTNYRKILVFFISVPGLGIIEISLVAAMFPPKEKAPTRR